MSQPPEDPPPFEPDDVPVIDESMLHYSEVDFEKGMSAWPLVSILLIAACSIIFVCELIQGSLGDLQKLIAAGALDPPHVAAGEIWRLVSATFLHGGPGHLIGNALMLYVLGMACEHGFGRPQFVVLYVLSGVTGSLLSLTAGHVSVGASGAIFGLAGAIVVYFWRHRRRLHLRDKRTAIVLAVWAGYQLLLGAATPGVDNLAHLGGLMGGSVLGLVLQPALVIGKQQVASHPTTRIALALTCGSLISTAIFFVPCLLN
jgi:rhomboid protease GluP